VKAVWLSESQRDAILERREGAATFGHLAGNKEQNPLENKSPP
jgi:hypothetical protein